MCAWFRGLIWRRMVARIISYSGKPHRRQLTLGRDGRDGGVEDEGRPCGGLGGEHAVVQAAAGEELLVGAVLDDPAAVQPQDAVGQPSRRGE